MKFDVVVGNPPYQNPGKTRSHKLWYRFIFLFHSVTEEQGYVAAITPSSWMRGGYNIGKKGVLKDIFGKEQLLIANVSNITKKYFSGIGADIGWWVFHKRPIYKETELILKDKTIFRNLQDIEVGCPVADSKAFPIFEKFIDPRFEKEEETVYFNIKNKDRSIEHKQPSDTHTIKHWILGGNENTEFSYLPNRFNNHLNYRKILFAVKSHFWQPYVDMENIGVISQGYAIPIRDGWTTEGILSVFESKLWRLIFFYFQIRQNGFLKTAIVRKTPRMDLSRTWTGEELYEYFGLTQEEIDYIERAMK